MNWHIETYFVFLVLSCIWKTRNNSSNSYSWGNLAGIDHNQQFHEHIINLTAACLNNVNIFSTYRLTNLNTETYNVL